METDFLLERTLKELNPQLHQVFRSSILAIQSVLCSYQVYFPTYTDHSILHSIDVTNFCCKLIGEQISTFNADEIYVLLMACYLHDAGMGISKNDFKIFAKKLNLPDVPEEEIPDLIRTHHHDFSGLFIRKYCGLFDIPSAEHIEAIVNVSRGHRKTDLYSTNDYDPHFTVPNGNTICLPYLASLIRIADEIDVAEDRNVSFLYEGPTTDYPTQSRIAFGTHHAIKRLNVLSDCYEMIVDSSDKEMFNEVLNQNVKIQKTIDYCVDVVREKTSRVIHQDKIKVTIL